MPTIKTYLQCPQVVAWSSGLHVAGSIPAHLTQPTMWAYMHAWPKRKPKVHTYYVIISVTVRNMMAYLRSKSGPGDYPGHFQQCGCLIWARGMPARAWLALRRTPFLSFTPNQDARRSLGLQCSRSARPHTVSICVIHIWVLWNHK